MTTNDSNYINPYDSNSLAYMRMMLQAQQPPTIEPIKATGIGDGIAQGLTQAVNGFVQQRYQQQMMQQLQGMQQAQYQEKLNMAAAQKEATKQMMLTMGYTPEQAEVFSGDHEIAQSFLNKKYDENALVETENRTIKNKVIEANALTQNKLNQLFSTPGMMNPVLDDSGNPVLGEDGLPQYNGFTDLGMAALQEIKLGRDPTALMQGLLNNQSGQLGNADKALKLKQDTDFYNRNQDTMNQLSGNQITPQQAQYQYGVSGVGHGLNPNQGFAPGKGSLGGVGPEINNQGQSLIDQRKNAEAAAAPKPQGGGMPFWPGADQFGSFNPNFMQEDKATQQAQFNTFNQAFQNSPFAPPANPMPGSFMEGAAQVAIPFLPPKMSRGIGAGINQFGQDAYRTGQNLFGW